MKTTVPKEKMGKKARRELNLAKRTTWTFSPVSRVKDSRKGYRRERIRPEEYRGDFLFVTGWTRRTRQPGNPVSLTLPGPPCRMNAAGGTPA